MNIGRKEMLVVVLVCMVGVLVAGCNHNLIQEDGRGRSLAKLTLGGEKGLNISFCEGPTNTRLVTNETEETLQRSPTIREAELYHRLIEQGQSELALTRMCEDSELTADVQVKKELIKHNLGRDVVATLNR